MVRKKRIEVTEENFRDLPNYSKNLFLINIFGLVSIGAFVLGLIGSIRTNYGDYDADRVTGLIMMIIGLAIGIVLLIIFMSFIKKTFPNNSLYVKPKNALELLPIIFLILALGLLIAIITINIVHFITVLAS